jgi:hypothetical protein
LDPSLHPLRTRHGDQIAVRWLGGVGGCSISANPYAVHPDTIVMLRSQTGKLVKLAPFTSDKPGKSEIMCRAVGMIQTPGGVPFERYVEDAFRTELAVAGLLTNPAPVTLSGHLERMHFSTAEEASWELRLALWGWTVRVSPHPFTRCPSQAVAERLEQFPFVVIRQFEPQLVSEQLIGVEDCNPEPAAFRAAPAHAIGWVLVFPRDTFVDVVNHRIYRRRDRLGFTLRATEIAAQL